jgi:hypothetical protein
LSAGSTAILIARRADLGPKKLRLNVLDLNGDAEFVMEERAVRRA